MPYTVFSSVLSTPPRTPKVYPESGAAAAPPPTTGQLWPRISQS